MTARTKIILISVLVAVIGTGLIFHFKNSSPTLLTVIGEGRAKSPPEMAQFTITYIVEGSVPVETLAAEKNLRQKIITLLTGIYGVEQGDLQISYPKIAATTSVTGKVRYQGANTIDVKFKKLASLDEAINKLYQTGDINIAVSNFVFTTTNPRDLEDQAINEAMKDGMIRAEKIARASGKNLGRLVTVAGQQTQAVGTVSTDISKTQGVAASAGTTSQPGQIELTRNVSLVYELR